MDSYRLELENLSDAIRGEGELLLGREDAVAQARALEALHESATGRPVTPCHGLTHPRLEASRFRP